MTSALEQTERNAEQIRGQLLSTLKELDRRRRRAVDLPYQVRTHVGGVVTGLGVAVLGGTLAAVVWTVRRRTRRARLLRARVHALMRAWEHPERIARTRRIERRRKLAARAGLFLAGAAANRMWESRRTP